MATVFVTGGTGYVGRPLIEALLARGHRVHALTREASAARLPAGAIAAVGDALDAATFEGAIPKAVTLVHLVGTPNPNPSKAAEFERVDLASIRASARAAAGAGVAHFVYVSVAHPAPVMQAYVAVRVQGEAAVAATGIPATILRPWYVLGPGHYWPYLLLPLYALGRLLPSTREQSLRMSLVTLAQMVCALVAAVEAPPASGTRIIGAAAISAMPKGFR